MNSKNFDTYSKFYDLLYNDKNYKNEAVFIFNKINKYFDNISKIKVLEIGCGTGIHSKLLKKKGLDIIGIEPSIPMANQAIKNGVDCFIFDSTNFNFKKKFDVVISLFHVISYLTNNDDLIKTFKNIHKHLNNNGIFIFDVWYSPAVYNIKPETRIKRVENNEFKIIRLTEPEIHVNKNTVDVNYELLVELKKTGNIEKINEKHSMRHFSIPEIQLLADYFGFELIESKEWLTNNEPSENTWGVLFILRKRTK
ncbi:MAG: class I SAM-dependent methyltransferase [Ignavibacteriales bacterium]|nr:class I SAM-dependent methyltransferase [Ignavibacteriales bacterium]